MLNTNELTMSNTNGRIPALHSLIEGSDGQTRAPVLESVGRRRSVWLRLRRRTDSKSAKLVVRVHQLEAENSQLKAHLQAQSSADGVNNEPSPADQEKADDDLLMCAKKYSVMISPWLNKTVLETLGNPGFQSTSIEGLSESQQHKHKHARELFDILPTAEHTDMGSRRFNELVCLPNQPNLSVECS
jgi:hypothetical protein